MSVCSAAARPVIDGQCCIARAHGTVVVAAWNSPSGYWTRSARPILSVTRDRTLVFTRVGEQLEKERLNYSIEGVLLGLARCKLDVRREPCSAKVFRLDAFFLRTAFSNLAAQRYLRDISSIGLKRSSSKFFFLLFYKLMVFLNRTSSFPSFHLKYLRIRKVRLWCEI